MGPVLTTWIFFGHLLCWAGHSWCTSQAESDINHTMCCQYSVLIPAQRPARMVCSLRQRGSPEPSSGLPQWISHAMFLLFVIAVCHVLGQGITISLLVCLLHKTRKMWKMVECGKSWKENCWNFIFSSATCLFKGSKMSKKPLFNE